METKSDSQRRSNVSVESCTFSGPPGLYLVGKLRGAAWDKHPLNPYTEELHYRPTVKPSVTLADRLQAFMQPFQAVGGLLAHLADRRPDPDCGPGH